MRFFGLKKIIEKSNLFFFLILEEPKDDTEKQAMLEEVIKQF